MSTMRWYDVENTYVHWNGGTSSNIKPSKENPFEKLEINIKNRNCPGCVGCDRIKQPSQCPVKCERYHELIKILKEKQNGG
jgi:hypothetical protein